MSKIETIITTEGQVKFLCYCNAYSKVPLCPECRDRIWLRLGQLINEER